MSLIFSVFGRYAMQAIVYTNNFLELLFCTALFCWYFKRKKLFVLRIALSIAVSLGIMLTLAVLRTEFNNIWTRFFSSVISSAIPLGIVFVCFDENISEKLLCWCGAISAFQVTAALVGIIYAAAGVDDRYSISLFGTVNESLDWFMYYLMHIALYVGCSFLFSRKKLRGTTDYMRNIVLLSVFVVTFTVIMSSISREFENDDLIVRLINKILSATLFTVVLVLRTGIFTMSKQKQDIKIMEGILREEKKQFERVKDNIEIINMKCHDLKHHLADLEGKISSAELEQLKNAIDIYDTSLKTGNDILDVVLYEKSLVCERENIKLDCLADGKSLGFMSAPHIYSLFGNAIDNAIEAVRLIPDPALRTVGITVRHKLGLLEITVINRFIGERDVSNGAPTTSKDDKARHGYGIKSIKYIAQQYGGHADISAENGIFTMRILLPPQN